MLKRAQCQAAREHPQTMAGVGLGCRRCHQMGSAAQAVREHPPADKRVSGCQGTEMLIPMVEVQCPPARTIGKVCSHQNPAKLCSQECPVLPRSCPQTPCNHTPLCLDPQPLSKLPGGPKSHQTRLRAAAALRRSLLQSPHGCQSSGDNELLMCLKSDAGCMARS